MGSLPFGSKRRSNQVCRCWGGKGVTKTTRSLWAWVLIPPHIRYMARRERVSCYTRAAEYSEESGRVDRKERVTLLTPHSVAIHFWRLRAMWRCTTDPAVGQWWHADTRGLQCIASYGDVVPTTLCLEKGRLYFFRFSIHYCKHCSTGYHLRQTHPNAVVPRLSFRLQGLHAQPAANGSTAQAVAALHLISNYPHLKTATPDYESQRPWF